MKVITDSSSSDSADSDITAIVVPETDSEEELQSSAETLPYVPETDLEDNDETLSPPDSDCVIIEEFFEKVSVLRNYIIRGKHLASWL